MKFCRLLLPLFAGLSAFAAGPTLHLLHKPVMNKTTIVFTYAGDLWSVPREGGLATPPSNYLMPTGATAETFPFRICSGTPASANNSVPVLTAIGLPAGLLVSNISLIVNTAAVTVTNGWYALLNSSLSVLAVSAAQSSGQWASTAQASCLVTLAMVTPVTTAYSGLYYIAVSTTAATNAKFMVQAAANTTPRSNSCKRRWTRSRRRS